MFVVPILFQVKAANEVLLPIKFNKGWNAFSLPIKPVETDLDRFFQGAKSGPMWQFVDGQYLPSESIDPGSGYWVFLENDLDFVFSGKPTDISNDANIGVKSGWNVFGVRSPILLPVSFSSPLWRYKGELSEIVQEGINPGEVFGTWFPEATQIELDSVRADGDGDGVPDYWEFFWGMDFESDADGSADADDDDLDSLFEFKVGTDPTKPDTDNDGLTDDQEVKIHRTNPRLADTDNDGITDNEEVQQGTNPFPGVTILLIDDQGGFGTTVDILRADGHEVTVINNEFANNRANLLNFEFLRAFDLIIWGASGDGFGTETPTEVVTNLESYIQAGGNLLVTGIDSLGSPIDFKLANLVRATFPDDQASGSPMWSTNNIDNFILNGIFGDFRDQTFSAIAHDDDQAIADDLRGALTLAVTPKHSDKIIFTSLPFAGSVGFWNGGSLGTARNAQPDFNSGGIPQNIFRNWVAGIRHHRMEGGVGFDTVAPVIQLRLENDTGAAGDGITSTPIISGSITDESRIIAFRAGFDDTSPENFSNALNHLKTNGNGASPKEIQFAFEPVYFGGQRAPETEDDVVFSFLPHDENPLFHVKLNNQGQVAFGARLRNRKVGGNNFVNNEGIWFGRPGQLQLVARKGFQAPGTSPGTQFLSFSSFQINDLGEIVFMASLAGDEVTNDNDQGIWIGNGNGLDLIVREGMLAPGTADVTIFSSINAPLLSNNGKVAFRASVIGPEVTGKNNQGIWVWSPEDFHLLVRRGDPHPDSQGAIGSLRDPVAINQAGQVLFSDFFTLFLASPEEILTPVISRGEPISQGVPKGTTVDSFSNLALNEAGEILFSAFIAGPGITPFNNNLGIWAGVPDDFRLVVREGMQAYGRKDGIKFNRLLSRDRLQLNDQGQVSFIVTDTRAGIWIDDFEAKTNVARDGMQIPESEHGTTFSGVTFSDPVLNNAGQLIFRASGRILFYDPDREQLSMVIRENVFLELAPGSAFIITTLSPFGSPGPMSLNDSGQIVFEADLSSSNWGYFIATKKEGAEDRNRQQEIADDLEVPEEGIQMESSVNNQTFSFNLLQLSAINGGPLNEGLHTLRLQAVDEFLNISNIIEVHFELDTVPPQVPTLELIPESDSMPIGDLQTNIPVISLAGTSDPFIAIELSQQGATVDDFESYSLGEIIGVSATSKPWKRFGPATDDFVRVSGVIGATLIGKGLISGKRSGQYSLDWSLPDSDFGAVRFQFEEPVNLSERPLVSVKMVSDDPLESGFETTFVSFAFSNGTTTYRTTKHVTLTQETQTISFKTTEPDVFLNEGIDSYADVISNTTEVGFTFTSLFRSSPEIIIFDDFIFPVVGTAPSAPQTVVADADGNFTVEDLPLNAGPNDFTVRVTDEAGNQSESTIRIIHLTSP